MGGESCDDLFTAAATRLAGLTAVTLGWRPHEFWAATPAELASVLSALTPPANVPPTRTDLARLMETYPDADPDQ